MVQQEEILNKNCYFYTSYTKREKRWFNEILGRFLIETKFLGHNIDISDEIKIIIGAWAVRMIVNLPFGSYYYSHVDIVNVYSGHTVPSGALGQLRDGVFYCYVDLAWDDVMQSINDNSCKSSTIIHEFAHALDQKDRIINGVPSQALHHDQIENWKLIFNSVYFIKHPKINKIWKYFELSRWNEFKAGNQSCIEIGEVFAVASEKYFEDPKQLKRIAPEIYEQLNLLFKQDTASLKIKESFGSMVLTYFLKFWR